MLNMNLKAGGIVSNRRERQECDERDLTNTLAMEAYLVCPHCARLTHWFHPWLIGRSIDEGGGLMLGHGCCNQKVNDLCGKSTINRCGKVNSQWKSHEFWMGSNPFGQNRKCPNPKLDYRSSSLIFMNFEPNFWSSSWWFRFKPWFRTELWQHYSWVSWVFDGFDGF